MASYNKVILLGNLTRDPEMKYLPNQTPLTEFGMAMNRRWTGQDGEKREEVCFVDCKTFGRSAETLNQYLHKGSPVLIEGHLMLDRWQAQDGTNRSKLYVVVERSQFIGEPREQAPGPPQSAPQPAPPPQAQAPADEYLPEPENIPF